MDLAAARPDLVLPERLDVSTVGGDVEPLAWAVAASPRTVVVVDSSATAVVDAAGLGLLVSAHRGAHRAGRQLVLVAPHERLLRLLAVTHLTRVLHVQRASADAAAGTG